MTEHTREPISIRYHPPGLVVACAAGVVSGILSVALDWLRVLPIIQRGEAVTIPALLAEGRVFHWGAVLVSALFVCVFVALYLGLLVVTEVARRVR